MTEHKPFGGSSHTHDTGHIVKRILTVMFILLCAAGLSVYMIKTKPKATKAPKTRKPPLIECISLEPTSHHVTLTGMGTVIPSVSIDLKSNVGGQVVFVNSEFIPGGRFKKGDLIMRIDPRDYDLAIRKKQSLVHVAKANLDLEKGRQDVARGEFELMQKNSGRTITNNALALRKPQLDQAKAEYDSAMADLQAATLNKERTYIKAPFNGMVMSQHAHQGAQVSSMETLAVLVGTDTYWIEASLPIEQLSWISVPGNNRDHGSLVTIFSPKIETPFRGEVIRILGQLNDKSRLVGVLIEVDDPLGLKTNKPQIPLMLNDYVRIVISGKSMDQVIALPRALMRSPGQVWVNNESILEIRDIHSLWSDDDFFYVDRGLNTNDCIITSHVTGVVPSMKLRTLDDESPSPKNQEGQTP